MSISPHIHIQIPHYNNAGFLNDSISSVRRQTYENISYTVYDDCSEDETSSVLEQLNINNVVRRDARLGRVKNYHQAAMDTDSDWLVNLDSDDYYTQNDWIEQSINVLVSNQNDQIVHIQSNLLQFVSIDEIEILKKYDDDFYLISGYEFVRICLEKYSYSNLGSIYNTRLIQQFGAFSDDCTHTDFLTASRAVIQGNVLVGNMEVGVWREHDNNESKRRFEEEEKLKNDLANASFLEFSENFLTYKEVQLLSGIYNRNNNLKYSDTFFKTQNPLTAFLNSIQKTGFVFTILFIVNRFFEKYNSSLNWRMSSDLLTGLLNRGLSLVFSLVLVHYLTKYLGIEKYGWVGIYSTIISTIYLLDFGLTTIVTKELSQKGDIDNESKFYSLEVVYLVIGLVIFAITFFGTTPFLSFLNIEANQISLQIFRLISVAVFVQWPISFYNGALYGLGYQSKVNIAQLLLVLLRNLLLIILLVFFGLDIEGYFIWIIVTSIILLGLMRYYIVSSFTSGKKWSFSSEYIEKIRNFSLEVFVISLFGFVAMDVSNFYIARIFSLEQYGSYSILFQIFMASVLVVASLKATFFPYISERIVDLSIEENNGFFKKLNYIIVVVVAPSLCLIAFNSFQVLELWLDNTKLVNYIAPSLKWICIAAVLNALNSIPTAILLASEKTKFLTFLNGFLAVLCIPLIIFLESKYGFDGASIYWMIIVVIVTITLYYYVSKIGYNLIDIKRDGVIMPILISTIVGLVLFKLKMPPRMTAFLIISYLVVFYLKILIDFFRNTKPYSSEDSSS